MKVGSLFSGIGVLSKDSFQAFSERKPSWRHNFSQSIIFE